MAIVSYRETLSEVLYTIEDPNSPIEKEEIPAKQILASQPLLVEIYQYKNDVTIETRLDNRIQKYDQLSRKSQHMIIDYFEVGHYKEGMQLIENQVASHKKPPFNILITLINFILQPKNELRNKDKLVKHWLECKRAHALLLDILSLYGPDIYLPVFNEFRSFELISSKDKNSLHDDIYELLNTKRLSEYRDFWNFTDRVLSATTTDLETRCSGLVLDFFVNVLQIDLKSRVHCESEVMKSIFMRTLKRDALNKLSKFDHYLKLLLRDFPNQNEDLFHLTGDILNMIITVSSFDKVSSVEDLVSQTYIHFQEMTTDASQQFMQIIKYPSFILALCDLALADADVSMVPEEHRHYRKQKHRPLTLQKLFLYAFKTLPLQPDNLESIYRHIAVVSKYCMCVLSTATVSHKRDNTETNTAFPSDQLELLIGEKDEVMVDWENTIEKLLRDNKFTGDLPTLAKIRWSMKMVKITLTEYF
ncbi:uncharacterized protein ATC70_011339 [Mucor velutinosus]|uniref:Uncharacterized protein n=1 Tax=Mucor velutinosus TaxID=708070 RepID=A0AAN7I0J9_9FUNG|nr:hypothetical protein ATC70_011339 [Mucor velutinosus]